MRFGPASCWEHGGGFELLDPAGFAPDRIKATRPVCSGQLDSNGPVMPESFLTVNEIATLLKLNPQTVINWI